MRRRPSRSTLSRLWRRWLDGEIRFELRTLRVRARGDTPPLAVRR